MSADLETWDNAAQDWDRLVARDEAFRTALITPALESLIPNAAGLMVLDAGCGNGWYANHLSKLGARVKGLDGSAEMVRIAQKKFPDLEFGTQDFLQPVPEPDGGYDIILANMLLMHMSDISLFLKEAYRLLKPGGRLIFSVLHPAFNSPVARLYKTLWQKLTFAAPNLLTADYYARPNGRYEAVVGRTLTHYHRTLEDYSTELDKAGLLIKNLLEPHSLPPQVLAQNPRLEYAHRFPRFIFFNCIKP